MSYKGFKNYINGIAHRTGAKVRSVVNDTEKQLFKAVFADGTTISVRPGEYNLTARWGDGHVATATANI